ncbi:hypothetical protein D9M69_631750 [compost metagenome]
MKTSTAAMHRAITRNTAALLHHTINAPARAGPKARVALIEIPLRDIAAGTCSRGRTPTTVTIQAAMPRALPVPRTKVNNSNDQASSPPPQSRRQSTAAAPRMID